MRSSRAPREKWGRADFGALGVNEHVGLVSASIDGGAADLRQPDRLGLRHPAGRGCALDAAGPIVVCFEPPVANVLVAEHPRLAGAVGDRRADLGAPVGIAGVVPVKALAAEDVAPSGRRGRRSSGCRRPHRDERCRRANRPAASRDRCRWRRCWRGPQRVEVEIHIAGAVSRLMAEILGPVGGVGDLGAGPEHRLSRRRRAQPGRDEG